MKAAGIVEDGSRMRLRGRGRLSRYIIIEITVLFNPLIEI